MTNSFFDILKKMKKLTFGILICLICFLSLTQPTYADLINPDYYIEKCNFNEIEVVCRYKGKDPFGPKTYNECAKYENNPEYRELTGNVSSFGGSLKYCYTAKSAFEFIGFHLSKLLPLILVTLLIETLLFFAVLARSRKAVFTVILVNIYSVSLLYIATVLIPYASFLKLMVWELFVILFEIILLKAMLPSIRLRNIVLYSIFANIVSATHGNLILISTKGIYDLYREHNTMSHENEYISILSRIFTSSS